MNCNDFIVFVERMYEWCVSKLYVMLYSEYSVIFGEFKEIGIKYVLVFKIWSFD